MAFRFVPAALFCAVLAVKVEAENSSHFGSRPHIVVLLADDYGWANIGFHRKPLANTSADAAQGAYEAHTPTLDALAGEGIKLDRHYSYKICSPARSSFQSGRLAVHVNVGNTGVTAWNQDDPVSGYAGIPRNMTGLAHKMKQGGYHTSMVGKWDAGMATPAHTPQGRGYDSWYGYYQHANDYWNKGMGSVKNPQATGEIDICLNKFTDFSEETDTHRGGVLDSDALDGSCWDSMAEDPPCYAEQLFKNRTLEIIRQHDPAEPLFHMHAFHALHTPLQVPQSYLKKIDAAVEAAGGKPFTSRNRRTYAAMVMYMDHTVGELVKALQHKGMWESTLLLFLADNGGPIYEPGSANNHPLKGGKYNDFEGGVRVNAFLSGGFIPEAARGSVHQGVVSVADWYSTFSYLAGVDAEDRQAAAASLPPVDGVQQIEDILTGGDARKGIALHLSEYAVLEWPWKLIIGPQPYSRWTGPLYPNCSTWTNYKDIGPFFADFKVFDVKMNYSEDPHKNAALLWEDDCGDGCLYNLKTDPTEHQNLALQADLQPKLKKMQQLLAALNSKLFSPTRGEPQTVACTTAVDQGGYYGPFVDAEEYYKGIPAPTTAQKIKRVAEKAGLEVFSSDKVRSATIKAFQKIFPRLFTQSADLDNCNATGPLPGPTA